MIQYKYGIIDIESQMYRHNKQIYDNNIICFDIETTSGFLKNNHVEMFDYGKDKTYYDDAKQLALCYIWMLSVNDKVYYGRELSDFTTCVDELFQKINGNFIIWVHNLSFEFQFLLNVFNFDKIFAKSPHKVIYADYGRCRFRCSYFLTRLSLDTWGKQVGVKKLVGQLDYNIMRTPLTALTESELSYCEHDVIIMYKGIKTYLEKYKNKMHMIPLTQTGEIRKVVKNLYKNNMRYHNKVTSLLPMNAKEYARLIEVFAGGYTHANYTLANIILKNVKSRDETSAYPTMMIAYKYPMSRWWTTSNIKKYLHNDDYSLIIDVSFENIESIKFNNYISYSKAYHTNGVVKDNGRISYAKELSICVTGVDYEIIEKTYKWESVTFNKIYVAKNEYLDADFVKLILERYTYKTTLKDVPGEEEMYLNSKQFINSLYGMMVTAIIQNNVSLNNDAWEVEMLTQERITQELKKKREKPWANFLAYQWGVFVTAYARRALWQSIMWESECTNTTFDEDIIYMDTDSIKYLNNHDDFFKWYNNMITERLQNACEYHNIDFELTKPKDIYGKSHPLGIFEQEPTYDEFITLGAKRYAYKIGDKIGITVAGANKKKGVSALKGDLKNFKEDLIFDYEQSGRLIATYISDLPKIKYPDGYISKYTHGINLMPTTYTMGIADDYVILLATAETMRGNFSEIDVEELHKISKGEK